MTNDEMLRATNNSYLLSESAIQTDIMDMLLMMPSVAWCYVTTTGTFRLRGGSVITIGFPGMADIIGQMKTGELFALEVKKQKGKATKDQIEFIETVNRNGGRAGVVRCVEDALYVLKNLGGV